MKPGAKRKILTTRPPVLENVRVARLNFTVKRKTLDGWRL